MNATDATTDNKKHKILLENPSALLLDYATHPSPTSTFTEENDTLDLPSSSTSLTPPSPTPASASLSSSTMRRKGNGRGKDLLSEKQKKANHIASEQKRRANIRIGFDQLVDMVPNLNECQRSESLILQKSADYIRQLVETKNELRDRVRELQMALGEVPDQDSSEDEMDYGF